MSQLTKAQQVATFTSLTSAGGPYLVYLDFTNVDSAVISCISTIISSAVLTLQASADGLNYVTVPAFANANPVTLTAAATTIFNIPEGVLPVKYVLLSITINTGTMAALTVTTNTRTAAIVHQ